VPKQISLTGPPACLGFPLWVQTAYAHNFPYLCICKYIRYFIYVYICSDCLGFYFWFKVPKKISQAGPPSRLSFTLEYTRLMPNPYCIYRECKKRNRSHKHTRRTTHGTTRTPLQTTTLRTTPRALQQRSKVARRRCVPPSECNCYFSGSPKYITSRAAFTPRLYSGWIRLMQPIIDIYIYSVCVCVCVCVCVLIYGLCPTHKRYIYSVCVCVCVCVCLVYLSDHTIHTTRAERRASFFQVPKKISQAGPPSRLSFTLGTNDICPQFSVSMFM